MRGRGVIVTGAGQGIGRIYTLEFARAGASVLVGDGITVNPILPGPIETEMGMILFLASPASGYLTGRSIAVDGGAVHL